MRRLCHRFAAREARIEGLDARDGAVLAAALWLVAAARNDDVLAQSLRARVLQAAARHAAIAAIGAEVALLEGDMSSAGTGPDGRAAGVGTRGSARSDATSKALRASSSR